MHPQAQDHRSQQARELDNAQQEVEDTAEITEPELDRPADMPLDKGEAASLSDDSYTASPTNVGYEERPSQMDDSYRASSPLTETERRYPRRNRKAPRYLEDYMLNSNSIDTKPRQPSWRI